MTQLNDFLNRQIVAVVDVLKSYDHPVFEDEMAEDEENALFAGGNFECFIFATDGVTANDDNKTMSQVLNIYYYSENRDDLDNQMVDIISRIDSMPTMFFVRSRKARLQKKDTDRYVDLISIEFNRQFKRPVKCYG